MAGNARQRLETGDRHRGVALDAQPARRSAVSQRSELGGIWRDPGDLRVIYDHPGGGAVAVVLGTHSARATAQTSTCLTPAPRSTVRTSFTVLPVVMTSSTTATCPAA